MKSSTKCGGHKGDCGYEQEQTQNCYCWLWRNGQLAPRADRIGIEGLELAGMYDIKEERQQAARDLGYRAYDSFEDVLADESVI